MLGCRSPGATVPRFPLGGAGIVRRQHRESVPSGSPADHDTGDRLGSAVHGGTIGATPPCGLDWVTCARRSTCRPSGSSRCWLAAAMLIPITQRAWWRACFRSAVAVRPSRAYPCPGQGKPGRGYTRATDADRLEKVFLLDRPPLHLIVFEMPQHIHQRIGSGVAQLIPQRARHRHYSHGGPILSGHQDHDQSTQLPELPGWKRRNRQPLTPEEKEAYLPQQVTTEGR